MQIKKNISTRSVNYVDLKTLSSITFLRDVLSTYQLVGFWTSIPTLNPPLNPSPPPRCWHTPPDHAHACLSIRTRITFEPNAWERGDVERRRGLIQFNYVMNCRVLSKHPSSPRLAGGKSRAVSTGTLLCLPDFRWKGQGMMV